MEKHDEDYILANIAVVEEQLQNGKLIKNIPAYLMKAFAVDFTPVEPKKIKVQKQKRAEQEKEKLELAILEAKYKQERKAKLEAIFNNISDKEIAALKEEFEADILQTNFHADIYKTK